MLTRLTAAFLLGACIVAPVAGRAPQEVTTVAAVTQVDVTGTTHLTRDQIIKIGALPTGRVVTSTDLDASVARLIDSGLVTSVKYQLALSGGTVHVMYEVVEPLWTMAVLLDNFIWFSDGEVYREIGTEIPGFDGAIPDTEGAARTVTRVLQRLLDARHLPGRVDHQLDVRLNTGRQKQRFFVTGVPMSVCAIEFQHASPANELELAKSSKFLLNDQYSRERLFRAVEGNLTEVYKRRGYLEATFHAPHVEQRSSPTCNGGVAVTIEVDEGPIFKVKDVTWIGNTAIATKTLQLTVGVKPGELADTTRLEAGLIDVKHLYERLGHLRLSIVPTLLRDRANRVVTYQMDVTEGPAYKMGDLSVTGLTGKDATRLMQAWPIKAGGPFNMAATTTFQLTAMRGGMLPAGRKLTFSFQTNHDTATVDVTLVVR